MSNIKHGMRYSAEYQHWCSMKQRCNSSSNYIKKGITVCPEWINNFNQFYADMGQRPTPNHTIDRINNDLGYEPGNCRWATQKEQQNNRTNNHNLTHEGVTLTLAEWAERKNISRTTLQDRLNAGWTIEKTLNTPSRGSKLSATHTMNGITKTIKEWLLEYNVEKTIFYHRVKVGRSITDAIITPVRKKTPRKVA